MSDGDRRDRDRRRVGDETLKRIDGLASGWKVPSAADLQADQAEQEARERESGKRRTPPPPPGSAERTKRESEAPRGKKRTTPPPPPGSAGRTKRDSETAKAKPPARTTRASVPPPLPKAAKRAPLPEPAAKRAPLPEPVRARPESSQPRARRVSDSIPPEPDPTEPSGVSATASSAKIERARRPSSAATKKSGTLRVLPTLRRKRGMAGDIKYIITALFGVREARRELQETKESLRKEQDARRERLIEVATIVIGDDSVKLAMVETARERLVAIEERRSKKAGSVYAAEDKITMLVKELKAAQQTRKKVIDQLEHDLKAIRTSLEPLEKTLSTSRRKANEHRASLLAIDRKIEEARSSLVSVKGPKEDAAGVEANIASLRAEREAIAAEEPLLAEEVDDMEPKIASLNGSREEIEDKIKKLSVAEEEDKIRTDEKVAALNANKAVHERSVADCAKQREEALLRLGEQINDERPAGFALRLRAVEQHELTIGTLDRRVLELTELVSGVDRAKLARGSLWLFLIFGSIAGVIVAIAMLT